MERKQFNIKLPVDLYDKVSEIAESEEELTKTEVAIRALEYYIAHLNRSDNITKPDVISDKDARIHDLKEQLERTQDNYNRLYDAFSFVGQKLQPPHYEKPEPKKLSDKIKRLLGGKN